MGKAKTKMLKLKRRRFIHDFEIESWKDSSFNYEWNVKNSQKTVSQSQPRHTRDAEWLLCVCFGSDDDMVFEYSLYVRVHSLWLCLCVRIALYITYKWNWRNSHSTEYVLFLYDDNVDDVVDDISSLIWRSKLGDVCRCFEWDTFNYILYIVRSQSVLYFWCICMYRYVPYTAHIIYIGYIRTWAIGWVNAYDIHLCMHKSY